MMACISHVQSNESLGGRCRCLRSLMHIALRHASLAPQELNDSAQDIIRDGLEYTWARVLPFKNLT